MTLLLRALRRITSVEESLAVFARINFGSRQDGGAYDMNLSVYELDEDGRQVTQARTEHRASFCDPPEPQEPSISLHGFPEVDLTETLGETAFTFTQKQHREMNFFDDDEVLAVAEVVRAQLEERQLITTAEAMWEFVTQRLREEDPEWIRLCGNKKRWKKWVKTPPRQAQLPEMGGEGT
jgi:hypothetical protein